MKCEKSMNCKNMDRSVLHPLRTLDVITPAVKRRCRLRRKACPALSGINFHMQGGRMRHSECCAN